MASVSPVVLIGLARLKRNADWQRLENWNWREKLSFLSHGVTTEIQVTEPAAMVPVKLRLPRDGGRARFPGTDHSTRWWSAMRSHRPVWTD